MVMGSHRRKNNVLFRIKIVTTLGIKKVSRAWRKIRIVLLALSQIKINWDTVLNLAQIVKFS
tara:strand:+ start:27136 stop:27321 length:186 start_codon:yes stop_codon:yes gene_type:complete